MAMPLETRTYKFKNPALRFFCPLCNTKRAITCRPSLTKANYLQIAMISGPLMYFSYPIMSYRSFIIIFMVWISFEAIIRLRFSKQVPCPHCGFDASWYKRDVRVARTKVKDFWDEKNEKRPLISPEQQQEETPAESIST